LNYFLQKIKHPQTRSRVHKPKREEWASRNGW
jgi:hypothetical protein